jgi:hypothetical protein
LLFFSVNLVLFTHIPITAERSISVFMLGYMRGNAEQVVSRGQIEEFFVANYVYKNDAIKFRIDEQLESGNIAEHDGGYKITPRGETIMYIYDLTVMIFGLDDRLVNPDFEEAAIEFHNSSNF